MNTYVYVNESYKSSTSVAGASIRLLYCKQNKNQEDDVSS